MTRTATFIRGESSILGAWQISCDGCPLNPHYDALRQNRKPCLAGIETNAQGALVINSCHHRDQNSVRKDGETLTLECNHE